MRLSWNKKVSAFNLQKKKGNKNWHQCRIIDKKIFCSLSRSFCKIDDWLKVGFVKMVMFPHIYTRENKIKISFFPIYRLRCVYVCFTSISITHTAFYSIREKNVHIRQFLFHWSWWDGIKKGKCCNHHEHKKVSPFTA